MFQVEIHEASSSFQQNRIPFMLNYSTPTEIWGLMVLLDAMSRSSNRGIGVALRICPCNDRKVAFNYSNLGLI